MTQGHHDHHHHGGGHDEHHHHGHGAAGHVHAPASFGMAFAIGATLNTAFVAAQLFYGLVAHSTALLADAVHNLGDVLGLLIAWVAAILARRHPTTARTYGWGRTTILASLVNAAVLLLGCGAIALEAVERIGARQAVDGGTVMWVAALGIVINGASALLFLRGKEDDLNIRGAFLHLAADALVSAGVVVAGLLILLTGWHWLDPVTSLAIVAFIVVSTWGLLRDSVNLALDGVPQGIALADVETALLALPGITDVHDLHVWGLSTTDTAMTAHLVGAADQNTVQVATGLVHERFGIAHATFQIETPELAETCALRPAHVI